jgi:hypothetical protein
MINGLKMSVDRSVQYYLLTVRPMVEILNLIITELLFLSLLGALSCVESKKREVWGGGSY